MLCIFWTLKRLKLSNSSKNQKNVSRWQLVMEQTMFQWSKQRILELVYPVLRGLRLSLLLIFLSLRNHSKQTTVVMNRQSAVPLDIFFSFLNGKSFDFLNDCYSFMADIRITEWVFSWIISCWRIFHLLSLNSGMVFTACFLQQKSTMIWWLQFSMLFIPLYLPLSWPYSIRWDFTLCHPSA